MDTVYVGTAVLFFAATWGLVRLIGGGRSSTGGGGGGGPGGASR